MNRISTVNLKLINVLAMEKKKVFDDGLDLDQTRFKAV